MSLNMHCKHMSHTQQWETRDELKFIQLMASDETVKASDRVKKVNGYLNNFHSRIWPGHIDQYKCYEKALTIKDDLLAGRL